MFRGFGLVSAEDLHDVIEATCLQGMEYVGGAAVRTQLTPRVFTANESPSTENIPFHHEMAREYCFMLYLLLTKYSCFVYRNTKSTYTPLFLL